MTEENLARSVIPQTNQARCPQRIQEWSTSDYLAQNPEYSDMVVTNFIAFNNSKSENDSYGGEVEIHAGWDEDVCLNAVGNMTNSNGVDINTYHCDYVSEASRYGSDMKVHADSDWVIDSWSMTEL